MGSTISGRNNNRICAHTQLYISFGEALRCSAYRDASTVELGSKAGQGAQRGNTSHLDRYAWVNTLRGCREILKNNSHSQRLFPSETAEMGILID